MVCLAGAYGNRTHQEPLSRPLTGFEDRAEHQLRTRSRVRQDTSEHDANRRNPLFYWTKRSCTPQHPTVSSRQNPTHPGPIRPLRFPCATRYGVLISPSVVAESVPVAARMIGSDRGVEPVRSGRASNVGA